MRGAESADERRLRAVTESINDAVISVDGRSRIVFWNGTAESMFGWTEEEVLGRPLTDLMPPEYRDAHLAGLARLRRTGEARVLGRRSVRLQGLRRDGSVFPLELSLGRWQRGDAEFYTGIVRDISEREAAEAAVRRLAAIVDGSEDAILSVSPAAVIMSWNPGAEKLYGYARDEIVGRPLATLVPSDRVGEERMIVERVMQGETLVHYETERVDKDGRTIPIALTVSPIRRDGDIIGVSLIGRDISERRRAEAALRRSNAELEQFAAVASHDLAAPANAIRGLAEVLERRYRDGLDETGRELVATIRRSAIEMQGLITDLLAYARVGGEEARREAVDLKAVLAQAMASLAPAATASALRLTHDPLPTVPGSPEQLARLFQNLLENAIKFRSDLTPEVHVSAQQEPQGWRFVIADNGVGIPPGSERSIFTMFTRAHDADRGAGTGIGLAIAMKIVEAHGGRIWAERGVQRGARICFELPA